MLLCVPSSAGSEKCVMEIEKAMRVASPQGSGKFVLCVDLNGLGMRDLNPVTATTSASFILNHYPGCIGQVRRQLCTAKIDYSLPPFAPHARHHRHHLTTHTTTVCGQRNRSACSTSASPSVLSGRSSAPCSIRIPPRRSQCSKARRCTNTLGSTLRSLRRRSWRRCWG